MKIHPTDMPLLIAAKLQQQWLCGQGRALLDSLSNFAPSECTLRDGLSHMRVKDVSSPALDKLVLMPCVPLRQAPALEQLVRIELEPC